MSTAIGREAEAAAAAFLRMRGCKLIARNWRTRWCEIDIIAQKANRLYFVEVKYRGSDAWGSGLEYITYRKLQQMRFAADFWLATHPTMCNISLAAIELTGDPPRVSNWADDF